MIVDWHALDPRSKLGLTLAVSVSAIAIPSIAPLGALVVGLVALVAAGSRIGVRAWLDALSPLRYLIPILFGLNAVFYGGGRVLWSPASVPLVSVTTGGLETSGVIVLRLLVVAGVAAWFAATTEPEAFELGLVKLGIPWSIGFLLSLTMRLVPELRDRFREIEDAQRSRGLEVTGSPIARVRSRIPMLIPFLAATIQYGYDLTEALAARDFGARRRRTSIVSLAHGPADFVLHAVSIGLLAVVAVALL